MGDDTEVPCHAWHVQNQHRHQSGGAPGTPGPHWHHALPYSLRKGVRWKQRSGLWQLAPSDTWVQKMNLLTDIGAASCIGQR
jgi:hypothetical protein